MNRIATELNKVRDVSANYRLIEEEEMVVDLDGRQHFEAALKAAFSEDEIATREALAEMRPFTTTCWKEEHPEARSGQITWPWAIH